MNTKQMSKTEAAEILATRVMVEARSQGVTNVDKGFYEEVVSEILAEAAPAATGYNKVHRIEPGSPIHRAAQAFPAYTTVRAAARRGA